ncbi:MAG TPA: hypothetical protein VN281_10150 [Verrucomicrobiae bacterium]|jgi:hypothetical protein|nr:hypothetical protein [Verrucomicrobiae bacterium]
MPTFAEFSSVVGTRFRARVTEAGDAVNFELTHATQNRAPANTGGKTPAYESFSLLFREAGQQAIPQGTYAFEHDRLGSFPMFIVPVSRESDAVIYQAVFNCLAQPTDSPR